MTPRPQRPSGSSRPRAYEGVVAKIEEAILRGEFVPGDHLPSERELAAQFGVSRPTVREALRTLENAGLIEFRPNDPNGGSVVTRPSAIGFERSILSFVRFDPVGLREVIEFRILLEGTTSYLAALRRTEEQLAAMVNGHEALLSHIEQRDHERFSVADAAFHHCVAEAAGNRLLAICSGISRGAMEKLVGEQLTTVESPVVLMRDFAGRHGRILRAIEQQDALEASSCATNDLIEYYARFLPAEDGPRLAALATAPPPVSAL